MHISQAFPAFSSHARFVEEKYISLRGALLWVGEKAIFPISPVPRESNGWRCVKRLLMDFSYKFFLLLNILGGRGLNELAVYSRLLPPPLWPCSLFHKIRVPGTLHKSSFGNADLLIRSCESAFANPYSLILRIRIRDREHIFYGIGRRLADWLTDASPIFMGKTEWGMSEQEALHLHSESRTLLSLFFVRFFLSKRKEKLIISLCHPINSFSARWIGS